MDMMQDIKDFHRKFGLTYEGEPRNLPRNLSEFREKFLFEELDEYICAARNMNKELQLDSLVDLVYVALGTAHLHGFDFSEAWRRVHVANMAKVKAGSLEDSRETGRNPTHDVVKPVGWVAPDHKDLVGEDNDNS